ncbi:hypothetical protein F2Q70_00033034 [Brassica cretica]|uniref:Uncharacterized protein n=1 Tax=Brassica cretica TaxID=69181 RepID=A0A8S9FEF6_BRACR|nr:hypothetical protein F2Q70_00033034 [Brassica cretica]
MLVYDEFECSGMLTRISHALNFSVHLKFESLRMRMYVLFAGVLMLKIALSNAIHENKKKTRRNRSFACEKEETKVAHLLLIVSFDDMQRAMPTFSSIALDRMLEPGARKIGVHHLYRLKLKLFPDESTETKPCAETQRHLELLGKIILIIVRAESTSEIWGLYARWSRIKGDLMAKQQLGGENLPRFEVQHSRMPRRADTLPSEQSRRDDRTPGFFSREESDSEFCTKDFLL